MERTDILYSFIIPHHNSPELLDRCLSTIPQRSDIEIIVVDDNSSEDKRPICQRTDTTILYIDKEHTKGAGRARNTGLAKANGKWLLFVDCDDMLAENAILALDKQKDSEHDIIFFCISAVNSDTLEPIERCGVFNDYVHNFRKRKPCSENTLRYNHLVPWGKMIRREMVVANNIAFDEVRYSNDIMFAGKCGLNAKSIGVSEDVLYTVTHREGSLVTQVSKESVYCRHEVLMRRIKLLMQHKKYLYINAPLSYITYSKQHYDSEFVDGLKSCARDNGYTNSKLYLLQLLYLVGCGIRHACAKL